MNERLKIMPDKCKACRRCEVACIAAHHGLSFKDAMKSRDTLVSRVQVVKAEGLKTSVRCHQCQDAPCCNICPADALEQDENGVITFNESLCVACEMCVKACPYGAISLDRESANPACDGTKPDDATCAGQGRIVAVRCDNCHAWRIENDKKITACMEACPVQCLYLEEPDGTIIEAPKPERKKVEEKKPEAVPKAPVENQPA